MLQQHIRKSSFTVSIYNSKNSGRTYKTFYGIDATALRQQAIELASQLNGSPWTNDRQGRVEVRDDDDQLHYSREFGLSFDEKLASLGMTCKHI